MTVTASSRMGAAAMPIAMVPKTCSSTFSSVEASSGAMKRTLPVSCRCLVAPASPAQARIRHSMRSGSSFMGGSLTYFISAQSFKRGVPLLGLCLSSSSRQTRHGYSSILPTPISCVSDRRNSNEKISERSQELPVTVNRREAMGLCGLAATLSLFPCNDRTAVNAAGLPEEEKPRICDVDCEKDLDKIPTETTPSGLQYKDILVGKGPSPLKGFQVAANYVAMIPTGKVFDSSLDKGLPYIFRVGSGQILQGLDEGILTMKVGGIRRLYIPGQLAFPKGLNSAAGRPRVPPASPVIFDVNLLYIPGLEDELPGEESPAPSSEISLESGDAAEDKTDL